MERLLVAGSLLSAGLAGTGFVVAAKGLLRFRELKSDDPIQPIDEITEYFLVGTFASVVVAAVGALLIFAAA